MADGLSRDIHTVDSTSNHFPHLAFSPRNMREMDQRFVQHAVNRAVDVIQEVKLGNLDGRFLSGFPGTFQPMSTADGFFYHVVGVSRGGDMSVAAP